MFVELETTQSLGKLFYFNNANSSAHIPMKKSGCVFQTYPTPWQLDKNVQWTFASHSYLSCSYNWRLSKFAIQAGPIRK